MDTALLRPRTLRPPLVTWEEPSEKSISLAGVRWGG